MVKKLLAKNHHVHGGCFSYASFCQSRPIPKHPVNKTGGQLRKTLRVNAQVWIPTLGNEVEKEALCPPPYSPDCSRKLPPRWLPEPEPWAPVKLPERSMVYCVAGGDGLWWLPVVYISGEEPGVRWGGVMVADIPDRLAREVKALGEYAGTEPGCIRLGECMGATGDLNPVSAAQTPRGQNYVILTNRVCFETNC